MDRARIVEDRHALPPGLLGASVSQRIPVLARSVVRVDVVAAPEARELRGPPITLGRHAEELRHAELVAVSDGAHVLCRRVREEPRGDDLALELVLADGDLAGEDSSLGFD